MCSCILLFAALLAGCPAPLNADRKEGKDLFLPGMYLVRGKAMIVNRLNEHHKYSEKATFSIEYVYVGDADLKSQTFQAEISRAMSGMRPAKIDDKFSFEKGELDIWWIRRDAKSKRLLAVIGFDFPIGDVKRMFGPARDVRKDDSFDPLQFPYTHCISYAKGVARAEKYEKLYKTAAMDRLALLKQYAREKEPLFAGRAVNLLAYCGLKESDYLKCLTALADDKKISIGAQLALDEKLGWAYLRDEDQLKAWYKSPNYLRFLQQWVADDLGDIETTAILEVDICERFFDLSRDRMEKNVEYLDYPTLLRIAITGLTNEKRSARFKNSLIQLATNLRPRDAAGRKAAFDYLTGEVQRGTTLSARVAAARLFPALKPLRGWQVAVVKALLHDEKNMELARYLTKALEESTKDK